MVTRRRIQWENLPSGNGGGSGHRDMRVSRMSIRKDGFVYFYPAQSLLPRLGKNVEVEVSSEGLRLKKSSRGPRLRESQANERPNFAIAFKRYGKVRAADEKLVEVETEIDSEGAVIVWWPWTITREAAE